MAPATCQNCATPSPSSASPLDPNGGPNLAVILGVLGGLALTAVFVCAYVPYVRRQRVWKLGSGRGMEGPAGSCPGWIGSRKRPSCRHHQETKTGPDGLLPLLPEVTPFTWSDVRSQQTDAGSVGAEDVDIADVYSFPTDNATTSHLNLQDGVIPHITDPVSVLSGPGGSAPARGSVVVSPSGNRSLWPLILCSKAPSSRDRVDESAGRSHTVHTNPILRVSLLPDATLSETNFHRPNTDMDPVWEQGHAVKAGSRSRPASMQLPSPPASPPVLPLSRSSSHARSISHVQSHSTSPPQPAIAQADWRFNPHSVHRPRPPHPTTASGSATTALPFRPSSSSATAPVWSPPVATNLNLPHSPPRSPPGSRSAPLTAAFRSSLHRSASDSTSATTSEAGRYPSITASPPPSIPETETWTPSSRARSGSVALDRPARPHGGRPRPVEMLRNESAGLDVRSGRRSSMSAVPSSSGGASTVDAIAPAEHTSRAYLRSSVSLGTPRVEEVDTPRGQSAALSYVDSHRRSHAPQASSGHASAYAEGSVHGPQAAELAAYSLSPSRRSSISHSIAPSPSARSQPALVRKKDSAALKPIPVSALLHSQPHSPPRSMHGREVNLSAPVFATGSRSRSGSVVSIPQGREGSLYEGRAGRRESARPSLPHVQPLPPMEFTKFDGVDDDDEE